MLQIMNKAVLSIIEISSIFCLDLLLDDWSV